MSTMIPAQRVSASGNPFFEGEQRLCPDVCYDPHTYDYGVGLRSTTRPPYSDYFLCGDVESAIDLAQFIGAFECPKCGSRDIMAPHPHQSGVWTCEPCGHDFYRSTPAAQGTPVDFVEINR